MTNWILFGVQRGEAFYLYSRRARYRGSDLLENRHSAGFVVNETPIEGVGQKKVEIRPLGWGKEGNAILD